MTETSNSLADLVACPECDLLLAADTGTPSPKGQHGHCPRCNARLWSSPTSSQWVLCASLSGLLLFVPAMTLPILKLTMAGQKGSNSLLGGVSQLWSQSEQILALLVLLCSVAAPLGHLVMAFALSLCQQLNRFPTNFPRWIHWHRWLQGWSMLEVYAMGVIVAYVKMRDDGEVFVASGTLCFVVVLLCVVICNQTFREEQAWQQWDRQQPRSSS